jgi:glutathione S-transferase
VAVSRFLLHHAPKSRGFRILWMLEELGADYAVAPHDLERGTQKTPGFLAINPDGKLPALEDRGPDGDWTGVVVTESAAICAYLADAMPGILAPAVGIPARAAYQTFLAYGAAVLEPALADQAFPRAAPAPPRALGWPEFPAAVQRVEQQLAASGGPYLLGQYLSAADLMVGCMLQWVSDWGMLTPSPAIASYIAALDARPALAQARDKEARLAAFLADGTAIEAFARGQEAAPSTTERNA